MKKIISLLLILLLPLVAFSQFFEVTYTASTLTPAPLSFPGSGQYSVTIVSLADDITPIPGDDFSIQITLQKSELFDEAAIPIENNISGTGKNLFTWSYNNITNVVTGVLSSTMTSFIAYQIILDIKPTEASQVADIGFIGDIFPSQFVIDNGDLPGNNTIRQFTSATCGLPTLSVGPAVCNSGNSTYSVSYISDAANIINSAGTLDTINNIITDIPYGTDLIITASNGAGCETIATVTGLTAVTCDSSCVFPDLSVGNAICPTAGSGTFIVSYSETTGATISTNLGIFDATTATGVIGVDLIITATNGSCESQITIPSPINCVDECENPPISIGGKVCASDGTYEVNYTVATGSIVTAIPGTVDTVNNQIIDIPSGEDVTITVSLGACDDTVIVVPAATCCTFDVTCPTFPVTTVQCYADLPSQNTYTETEFEALGNADGIIGDTPCGVIEITASNSADTGVCSQTITRTYTVTEYDDPNNNGIRDSGEDTVLNTMDCNQMISVNDTINPTWTTAAGDLDTTLECDDTAGLTAAQALFPVASDSCDADVTDIVKTTGPLVAGTCPQAGSYTNTWTVTDDCGNVSAVYTQTITIEDNTAPTWTTAAGDLDTTLECDDTAGLTAAQALFPVASDSCDADVTDIVKTTGPLVAGTCPQAGSYTNTWTVTDDCGNVSAVYTQTITIEDNTAPTWTTAAGDLDLTLECDDTAGLTAAQALFPVASDSCDANVTDIVKTTGPLVAGTCPQAGSYTNTWTVTDDCGNVSAVYTQTITIEDNTAPTWTTAAGDLDTTLECDDTAGLTAAQALFPVASDSCDADVTDIVKTTGPLVAGTCPQAGSYTNTWTVTDDCGNVSAVYTQTITIEDNTAPTWTTAAGDLDTTLECDDTAGLTAAQALFPVASDSCDADVTDIVKTTGPLVAGTCPQAGSYTNTWTVTDDCGNVSAVYTQTITIEDNTAPTWTTAAGDLDTTLECDDTAGLTAAQALFPVASDSCDADVTDIVKTTGPLVAGTCPQAGSYTNTWTVTDDCGNVSAVYTQTITIEDNTAPTWTTAAGDLDTTLECDDTAGLTAAQALFPVASDSCDANVTDIVKTTGPLVAGTCPQAGSYTNTWTVTDDCGNVSAVYTQTITIEDNTAPTWTTAAGDLDTTLECDDTAGLTAAQALFPVASDSCDADVTDIVKTTGPLVAGTCPQAGSYTNTWTVTDDCGNVSAVYTQTITIEDNTAPTWTTAAGDLDLTLECDDTAGLTAAQALFPVASDSCDADVTDIVKTTGPLVAGTCPQAGSYTNTWTVTDDCGNVSAVYTQTITIEDNTAPTWTTAAGDLDTTLECDDTAGLTAAQALFPVASDSCDANVTDIVKTTGPLVAGTCPQAGSYTNTWTVTDDCGNVSAVYTQTITIEDNTAPTWTTAAGDLDTTLECDDTAGLTAAQALFPVASDSCDADVTDIVKTTGPLVAGTCPQAGSYTNTWTVTDDCGNVSAVYTQTITIEDNTAPTWTTAAGDLDTTLECDDTAGLTAAQALFPVASDSCDADVTDIVKTTGPLVAGTCPQAGSYTNTWTVTDDCGNVSAVYTQTITIEDNTAPTGTAPNGDTNINACVADATTTASAFDPVLIAANYSDSCGNVVATLTDTQTTGTDCAWSVTYTYSISDECGNTIVGETITHSGGDQNAPTLTGIFPTGQTGIDSAADEANIDTLFPTANDIADLQAAYTDDCSTVNVTFVNQTLSGDDCAWSLVRTYNISDTCNNNFDVQITYSGGDQNSGITLVKSGNFNDIDNDGCSSLGDTITYTFTVNNTGSCALTNVNLNDPLLGGTVAGPNTGSDIDADGQLDANETWIYTIDYNITQDDINSGQVTNSATVTADDASGSQVTDISGTAADNDDNTITTLCQNGTISIVKSAIFNDENVDGCASAEETITYTFTVNNTGNTNLTNISITDQLFEAPNPIVTIAYVSGDDNTDGILNVSEAWIYTADYVITETDLEARVVINQASVSALDTNMTPVNATSNEVEIEVNSDCVVEPCSDETNIFISKAVTPNGDFRNDTFTVSFLESCGFTIDVQIFNRWGALIYEANNYQGNWSGESPNNSIGSAGKVPSGTYYYIVTLNNSGFRPFTGPIYVGTK